MKEVQIDKEKIYLKKSKFLGWTVIHPIKVNGKIVWKNLVAGGSWIKLGILAFIILIILGLIDEYTSAIRIANECLSQPRLLYP